MARTIPSQALQVSVSLGHVFEVHSVAESLHERHLKQNVFHQFKLSSPAKRMSDAARPSLYLK